MDRIWKIALVVIALALLAVLVVLVSIRTANSHGQEGTELFFARFDGNDFTPIHACYEWSSKEKKFNSIKARHGHSSIYNYDRDERWTLSSSNNERTESVWPAENISAVFDMNWYTRIQERTGPDWNRYTYGGERLDVDFFELRQNEKRLCSKLTNDVCDEDLNVLEYGFDAADCCSTTCGLSKNCAGWEKDIVVFDTNARGLHFSSCVDPSLKDITIYLNNFTSSYENLDRLYPKRNTADDSFWDFSKAVQPSTMKIQCDGRHVLVVDVENTMSEKTQTIRVNDGARCIVQVEQTNAQNCTTDCHVSENPFWVFDYSIYEGNHTSNNKMMLSQSSIDTNPFLPSLWPYNLWRIEECLTSEIAPESIGLSNFYEDETTLQIMYEWMTRHRTNNSYCDGKSFLREFKVFQFVSKFNGEYSIDITEPFCDWRVVRCNADNTFKLDLHHVHIDVRGKIPRAIGSLGDLDDLMALRLTTFGFERSDMLKGSIPSEIGKLTQLKELEINSNDLTGSIPSEIWMLTQLTKLDFVKNGLTGSIPPEIGKLTQLKELEIFLEDLLTGSIPSEIGYLTQLTELRLVGLYFTGSIPSEIGMLVQLERFSLEHNEFTGSIPSEIGKLTQLIEVFLRANELKGSIPTEIGKLSQLDSLNLRLNELTGSVPSEIGKLTSLSWLGLTDNQLTGTIPTELWHLHCSSLDCSIWD